MMAEFVITDPAGKEFVVNAPDGATQDQALEFAKSQFGSTPSGAAVGNPNLMAQGAQSVRPDQRSPLLQDLGDIAGAGAAGGALGAFSSEILRGGGRALGSLPYPAARTVGGSMEAAGDVLKAGGRVAPMIAGTISGLASETSGKTAEALGAGPITSEAARLAGGGLTAETANAATEVLRKYALTPALGLLSKFKHETAKVILEKLEGASVPLTQQEAEFVNQLIGEIRGPSGKTDVPLERVGSIMGDQGKRLLGQSDQMMMDAMQKASGVGSPGGMPGGQVPLADVGGALRDTITKRNEAALVARSEQYAANEKTRDAIVAQRESAGNYISNTPEYEALLKLRANLVPGARSPSVQAGYQKMIDELGMPSELTLPTMKGGVSFQAIDDVRRKLGDAFRGKPAEGYDAIGEAASKDLYGKVSELQKKFAGPAQTRLLDEYAAQTKGLEMFSSKTGKKATALDQYREEQFSTDPSLLPASFFKTRASIQALKELTGNPMQVNAAALHYADKELEGKTASEVRAWMGKNNEWLSETKPTLALVDKYATRLEGAERSMKNAQDFAKQAAKDSSMLTRQSLPAQRAVDLIRSGDTELWNAVAPAIAKSPQAKTQMVDAVRQVVADTATAESTSNLFARNIRPFLEKSNIASKQEMESIAKKLSDIQTLNIPERERLGMAKRLLLNSTAGWAASAASRIGFRSMEWAIPQ